MSTDFEDGIFDNDTINSIDNFFNEIGGLSSIELSDESEDISNAEDFLNKERASYLQVDEEFKRFISDFVTNQNKKDKQKRRLKIVFFWIIMLCFLGAVLLPMGVLYLINVRSLTDFSAIVAIISVLIELVSAIIVLPKIIAEYLFDKEEDKNMIELIKNLQDYNEKKHEHIRKNT